MLDRLAHRGGGSRSVVETEGVTMGSVAPAHQAGSVSDSDFSRCRRLPNGWTLNTKEELLYYRIFVERLGEMKHLEWMGRTKGAPAAAADA